MLQTFMNLMFLIYNNLGNLSYELKISKDLLVLIWNFEAVFFFIRSLYSSTIHDSFPIYNLLQDIQYYIINIFNRIFICRFRGHFINTVFKWIYWRWSSLIWRELLLLVIKTQRYINQTGIYLCSELFFRYYYRTSLDLSIGRTLLLLICFDVEYASKSYHAWSLIINIYL